MSAASVLVSLALIAVVAALPAVPMGAVTAPSPVRFQQLAHGSRHAAKQRVRGGAPDWWHYVAPWWSPPGHAKTKSPPDWVEDLPEYKNYAHPPKDTMGVYIPYGRDAMSWVETGATVHSTSKAKAKAKSTTTTAAKQRTDPALLGMNLNFRDLAEMRMINQLTSPDYNPDAAYAAGASTPSSQAAAAASSLLPHTLPMPMPPPLAGDSFTLPSFAAPAAMPVPPTLTSAAAMGSSFMPFLDVDYGMPSLPPSALNPLPVDAMRMQQQQQQMPMQQQLQMQMQQQQQQQMMMMQQQQAAALGYGPDVPMAAPGGAGQPQQQQTEEEHHYHEQPLPHEHDMQGQESEDEDEQEQDQGAEVVDEEEQAEAEMDDAAVAEAEQADGDDEEQDQEDQEQEQEQEQAQQMPQRSAGRGGGRHPKKHGRRPNLRSRESSFEARIWRGENDREAQEDYDQQLAELDEGM